VEVVEEAEQTRHRLDPAVVAVVAVATFELSLEFLTY